MSKPPVEIVQEAKDILYMAERMRANRGGSLDVYLTARVLKILAELLKVSDAPAQDTLRAAAERVCWFDWSDNDMDAVAAIDALRKAVTSSQHSSTECS